MLPWFVPTAFCSYNPATRERFNAIPGIEERLLPTIDCCSPSGPRFAIGMAPTVRAGPGAVKPKRKCGHLIFRFWRFLTFDFWILDSGF
jgi:hypothetical protein